MTQTPVPGADATSVHVADLPHGIQHAGYVTGGPGIPWTVAQFDADPRAVRIDQSPASTGWDATADIDDYENGAVTLAELAPRAKLRQAAFNQGTRHGQRRPGVYASEANLTAVVNALTGGGVRSGVGLWVAHWGLTEAEAQALVADAGGPFPVIGVQYSNQGGGGTYDIDVFAKEWLDDVAGAHQPGHLYWHTLDKPVTVAALAQSRGYPSALSFIDHQVNLQATNAERLLAAAELQPGGQWVSVNP